MTNYKVVLFDLDGTLLDTSPGIFNSVRFAEKMMNLHPIPQKKLCSFIGPPPIKSYMNNHGLSQEKAIEATKFHRQYGAEKGIYEAKVYKGIPELLQKLKNNDVLLGVCTLKRQDIAENVLKNFNLYNYFDVIVGIDQKESLSKADTINIALNKININDKSSVVLVGDSLYDSEGAAEANVDFIGVLYGFGLKESTIYQFKVVENVNSLIRLLIPNC